MQLSRAREAELREEVVLLQQEKKELQYNIRLLEQDNEILREEIEQLSGELCLFFLFNSAKPPSASVCE